VVQRPDQRPEPRPRDPEAPDRRPRQYRSAEGEDYPRA
jgi:hypothetical protein